MPGYFFCTLMLGCRVSSVHSYKIFQNKMENLSDFAVEWKHLHKSSLFYWELLQELPADILKKKPDTERWSLLQVLEHLAGAEAAGLQYLQRNQYAVLHNRGFLPSGIRALLLKFALRSPLRFKAPPVLAIFPTNTTQPAALHAQWQQTRKELAAYLEGIPSGKKKALLFMHPVAGPLTPHQMLVFMTDHLNHHRRQVQQLLAL